MLSTSSGPGAISGVRPQSTFYNNTMIERESAAAPAQVHSYDSMALSPAPDGQSRFQLELVSRLSQDVRTAVTTGDIQALRTAVASGQYTPDPAALARRMLFLPEEV